MVKLVKFYFSIISFIYLIVNINETYQAEIPEEVLKDILIRVTDEVREQISNNLSKSPVTIKKRSVRSVNPLKNAVPNPFSVKTSLKSIQIHNSFMMALNQTKKNLNSSTNLKNMRLKLAPQLCPFQFSFDCDSTSKYRNVDGSCNNLNNPILGKSNTPFKRYLNETSYDDGMNEPRKFAKSGNVLPNPRSISLFIHDPSDIPSSLTNLGVMLGQFIDHDFAQSAGVSGSDGQVLKCQCDTFSSDCINIMTPDEDIFDNDQSCMTVTRSSASFSKFNCDTTAREQTNLLTHYLDISGLYGNDDTQQNKLRSFRNGRLRSSIVSASSKRFLPFTKPGACQDESQTGQLCFETGDTRSNQNMLLTSIHTLWMREHNRVATELQDLNPFWNDDQLFQETKRIVIAEYQNIIYSEWLPIIVGSRFMFQNNLNVLNNGYFLGYNQDVNPHLAAEFSTAAYRFGHTLLRSSVTKADNSMKAFDNLTLPSIMFRNTEAYTNGGLDSICRGLLIDSGTSYDSHITDVIQNHLFENNAFDSSTRRFSLSAINIMRGRDHGIPPYNRFREFVDLKKAKIFDDLIEIPSNTRDKLKKIYEDVDDIDAFTGGLSEQPIEDALIGPTFSFIVARQFRDLKFGDRFYFENGDNPITRFSLPQLGQLRKASMSRIMCDNLELDVVQRNAFKPISDNNPLVDCKSIRTVKLNRWRNEKTT